LKNEDEKKIWQPGRFEPATNNQLLAIEILYFKIISVFYFQLIFRSLKKKI